jgi:von Willebrand factor type A domain
MSTQTAKTHPGIEAAPGSLAAIPGWLGSAVLHATILTVLLTSGVPSCSSPGDAPGDPGGDFRQVGLVVKQPTSRNQPNESDSEAVESVPSALQPLPQASELNEAPPVPLTLPETGPPVIGPGGAAPRVAVAPDVRDLVKPTGTPRIGGVQGVGPGEVQFFGAKDRATQVVYVVDCSGSMSGGPLAEAKARLVASLESLESTQRFQIIFYNSQTFLMALRGEQTPELYWATDINRTLAKQFIARIRADLGTDHMPAILRALSLGPEVVYLLTDADQPALSAHELNRIRTANRGRAHIHTIEFGEGARELDGSRSDFLQILAQQNGGTYRYQDVGEFRR